MLVAVLKNKLAFDDERRIVRPEGSMKLGHEVKYVLPGGKVGSAGIYSKRTRAESAAEHENTSRKVVAVVDEQTSLFTIGRSTEKRRHYVVTTLVPRDYVFVRG